MEEHPGVVSKGCNWDRSGALHLVKSLPTRLDLKVRWGSDFDELVPERVSLGGREIGADRRRLAAQDSNLSRWLSAIHSVPSSSVNVG